jgi:hypothetical protein
MYGGPQSRAQRSKVGGEMGVMGSWKSRRSFFIRSMMANGDWGLGRAQGSSSRCSDAMGFFLFLHLQGLVAPLQVEGRLEWRAGGLS